MPSEAFSERFQSAFTDIMISNAEWEMMFQRDLFRYFLLWKYNWMPFGTFSERFQNDFRAFSDYICRYYNWQQEFDLPYGRQAYLPVAAPPIGGQVYQILLVHHKWCTYSFCRNLTYMSVCMSFRGMKWREIFSECKWKISPPTKVGVEMTVTSGREILWAINCKMRHNNWPARSFKARWRPVVGWLEIRWNTCHREKKWTAGHI